MTTYSDLRLKVQILLDDVKDPDERQYDDDLIYEGIRDAHKAILPWVPKQLCTSLTSGSDGVTYTLPGSVYRIEAVLDLSSSLILPKGNLYANSYRGDLGSGANNWLDRPTGYVTLLYDNLDGIKVYYDGYWEIPTTSGSDADSFELEVPDIAIAGITYYACSVCLLPKSVVSASIRQFNVKVDSGNPEDNPLYELSDYFLSRFMKEMKMMPMINRSS